MSARRRRYPTRSLRILALKEICRRTPNARWTRCHRRCTKTEGVSHRILAARYLPWSTAGVFRESGSLFRRVCLLFCLGSLVFCFVFDYLQTFDHLEGEAHHGALPAPVLEVDGLVVVVDEHLGK